MPAQQVTLKIKVVRNYGPVSQTWEASGVFEVTTRADAMRGYESLQGVIDATRLDFEAVHLPKMTPAPKSIDQDQKGVGEDKKWVRALGITKVTEKGKTNYKVMTAPGTQFAKYGLSLYWDNFKGMTELEYSKRADENGDHVLPDDFMVLAVKENGFWRARAIAHKDMMDK